MKKRLHISSILLFIFVSSIVLPVEAQRIFSLDDCIQTGLERNFSIRIIRNEQQISAITMPPSAMPAICLQST